MDLGSYLCVAYIISARIHRSLLSFSRMAENDLIAKPQHHAYNAVIVAKEATA